MADLKRCRRAANSHQVQLVPQHVHIPAWSRTSSIHMFWLLVFLFVFCRAAGKWCFSLKELQMKNSKQQALHCFTFALCCWSQQEKQELRKEHHVWEKPAMINQSEPLKQWAGKRERFRTHREKAKSGHEQAASHDPLQSNIQEGFLLLNGFLSPSEQTLPSSSCFTSISQTS